MKSYFFPVQPEWHMHTHHLVKTSSLLLKNSVAYVYDLYFEPTEQSALLHGIPDGCIDLLFNLNGYADDCYIIPSTKERMTFSFQPYGHYFGIRLLPLQMIVPLDLPLHTLNTLTKAPLFLVSPILRTLYTHLLQAKTLEERLHIVEQFVLQQPLHLSPSTTIQNCLHIAYKEKGRAKLADLERATCYSARYLRNVFQDEIGISPKIFLDIVYVQFVVREMVNGNFKINEHLDEYNIYDVSHFYKKMKKALHMTPKAYLEKIENYELTKSIKR